jgi:hypothetical protein
MVGAEAAGLGRVARGAVDALGRCLAARQLEVLEDEDDRRILTTVQPVRTRSTFGLGDGVSMGMSRLTPLHQVGLPGLALGPVALVLLELLDRPPTTAATFERRRRRESKSRRARERRQPAKEAGVGLGCRPSGRGRGGGGRRWRARRRRRRGGGGGGRRGHDRTGGCNKAFTLVCRGSGTVREQSSGLYSGRVVGSAIEGGSVSRSTGAG